MQLRKMNRFDDVDACQTVEAGDVSSIGIFALQAGLQKNILKRKRFTNVVIF